MEKFIKIITLALKNNLGLSFLVIAYEKIHIEELLNTLIKEVNIKDTKVENINNLHTKNSICDLLFLYVEKLDKAKDNFYANFHVIKNKKNLYHIF